MATWTAKLPPNWPVGSVRLTVTRTAPPFSLTVYVAAPSLNPIGTATTAFEKLDVFPNGSVAVAVMYRPEATATGISSA